MDKNTADPALSLREFMSGILDLQFKRYLSVQLLPLFYALLLLGATGAVLLLTGLAFWLDLRAGLIMLLLAPLILLIAAAAIRAALEFLMMAYRIMLTVHEMQQIPTQVNNLNNKVERISAGFDPIPGQVNDLHQTVRLLQPILHTLHLPFRSRRKDRARKP